MKRRPAGPMRRRSAPASSFGAGFDRDADMLDPLDAGQRGQHMGEQGPAADRHQAFVGNARLGGERIELAVALGGEDDRH